MLPYIRSNASFYNHIAEEFFTVTCQASTKEEYEKLLFSFCKRWKRELTDENVLEYFVESGEMEPDTVDELEQLKNGLSVEWLIEKLVYNSQQ